jgi:uncharacterized membrane protein YfcA
MNKRKANAIITACLVAAVIIGIYTWITAPLVIYGMASLTLVGAIYGGYMGRHHIKSEIRRVIGEWRLKQLKHEEEG